VIRNNTLPRSEMLADKCDRDPDAAQAVASDTLVAKAESIPQPASWTDITRDNNELIKQNQAMAELNHSLIIVVQQAKLREEKTARSYKYFENKYCLLDSLYQSSKESYYAVLADYEVRVADLKAWLANNNAELISELQDTITTLQDTITSLEVNLEAASWTEWEKNNEIYHREEMVDSKNILRLEKSLDWARNRNRILCDEMSAVCMKKNQEYSELYTQLRNLQASHSAGEKAGEKDNHMSDDNASLFPCSDDDGSIRNVKFCDGVRETRIDSGGRKCGINAVIIKIKIISFG